MSMLPQLGWYDRANLSRHKGLSSREKVRRLNNLFVKPYNYKNNK
ncbi:hypothetical protein [Facklamia lactis]|nr:hypothetical protein [Facklamia lactis]